jgi:hypothetical protein
MNVGQKGGIYRQVMTVLVWTGEYDKHSAGDIVAAVEIHDHLRATPNTIRENCG